MTYDCIEDSKKYVKKILDELNGCSEWYMLRRAVFPFFVKLSIYFPEAYEEMLKELELKNEDN